MSNALILGGRYEVISRIGTGGMADVYKGLDRKLNRYVAIKVLKKEFSDDTKFVSKFKVEAQSAAILAHPNVVNVYDVAEESGVNYIVMELIEGITLKHYIEKRGQLTPKEAVSIAVQVACGLEAAHKNHIVHRDIKPQNIIISRDGKVKVTDFGIARAASSNTISSAAMGSVHYTSPEQARGGYSDFKSDIYSLGITLYEMVTGRVPFDGDTTVTIAIKHLQEDIIPPSQFADVPHSLEQIIIKCTQKSPDKRYFNIHDLIADLKMSLVDPDGDFVQISEPGEETTIYNPRIDDDYEEEELEDDMEFEDEDYRKEKGEVNPKVKKLSRVLMIAAGVVIALALLFIVGRATNLIKFGPGITNTDENTVKVPNIVGMSYDDAKKKLATKGLGIKEKSREKSSKYDEGIVTKQTPKSDKKVKRNSTVEVVVSSGIKGDAIEIPDVVGKTESEAQKILEKAGFKVKSETEESDDVEQGKVISQNPGEGEKAGKGATVTIKISKGTNKATVPNLIGMSKSDAKAAIEKAGLKLGEAGEVYSATVAKGNVVDQSIAAGETVDKKTSINIAISKGDVPVSEQTWRCNASITLAGYGGGSARVVLEQNGKQTTIVAGTPISNPYVVQADGTPGVSTGTILVYETKDGTEVLIGSATVKFSRVIE